MQVSKFTEEKATGVKSYHGALDIFGLAIGRQCTTTLALILGALSLT